MCEKLKIKSCKEADKLKKAKEEVGLLTVASCPCKLTQAGSKESDSPKRRLFTMD